MRGSFAQVPFPRNQSRFDHVYSTGRRRGERSAKKTMGSPDCATIDNLAGTCTEVGNACGYQKGARARRLPSPMILRLSKRLMMGAGVGRITRSNPKRSTFRH